eukprot:scaffold34666_cov158-Amphora_coffeaeformis.AAC.2
MYPFVPVWNRPVAFCVECFFCLGDVERTFTPNEILIANNGLVLCCGKREKERWRAEVQRKQKTACCYSPDDDGVMMMMDCSWARNMRTQTAALLELPRRGGERRNSSNRYEIYGKFSDTTNRASRYVKQTTERRRRQ